VNPVLLILMLSQEMNPAVNYITQFLTAVIYVSMKCLWGFFLYFFCFFQTGTIFLWLWCSTLSYLIIVLHATLLSAPPSCICRHGGFIKVRAVIFWGSSSHIFWFFFYPFTCCFISFGFFSLM